MMNLIAFGVPVVYYAFLIVLFAFLLVRGVAHLFIGLFTAGALLHFAQTVSYVILNRLPGGFGAYHQYLPVLAILGFLGTIAFVAGFVALAAFLLRGTDAANATVT